MRVGFDDVQQAATAWQALVGDTAQDARPERVNAALRETYDLSSVCGGVFAGQNQPADLAAIAGARRLDLRRWQQPHGATAGTGDRRSDGVPWATVSGDATSACHMRNSFSAASVSVGRSSTR